MTALAIAVHRRRAVLATDSLVVNAITGRPFGRGSKLLALPHVRSVSAWAGPTRLRRALDLVPPVADVRELVELLPPILVALTDRAVGEHRNGSCFIAGVVGRGDEAEVRAYALRLAEGFEPLKLEPGRCYVLGDIPPEPAEQDVAAAELRLPTAGKQSPPPAPVNVPWAELARMPTKIAELLRQERPGTVGGATQSCLLTCESLFYTWADP